MTKRRALIVIALVFGASVGATGVAVTVLVMSNALEHRPLASISCWR